MSNVARGAGTVRPQPIRRASSDVGSSGFAAVLSTLLPGLGQVYEDRWVRGILMLILPAFALTLALAFVAYGEPLTAFILQHAAQTMFVFVASLLAYHLYVVADAFAGRMRRVRGRNLIDYGVLAIVTLALIAGYATIYRQSAPWASLASKMFAPFAVRAVSNVPDPAAPPAWTGKERLNVLLLGIDTRDSDPASRNTDTMLVVSVDPVNKTAVMLSIPRDVYVNMPGTYQGKVNGAFSFGGPEVVRKVVDDLLGIRIHTYALVNFDAFNKIIDGVGGVVVDAKRPVRDEYYPTADFGIERIDILTGPQLMHGQI